MARPRPDRRERRADRLNREGRRMDQGDAKAGPIVGALLGASAPAAAKEELTPPVPINTTIRADHIISLEDGRQYRSLKRHLTARGLSPEQYRAKWGLRPDYPMVAPSYSKARSELAKALGLGQKAAGRKRKAGK